MRTKAWTEARKPRKNGDDQLSFVTQTCQITRVAWWLQSELTQPHVRENPKVISIELLVANEKGNFRFRMTYNGIINSDGSAFKRPPPLFENIIKNTSSAVVCTHFTHLNVSCWPYRITWLACTHFHCYYFAKLNSTNYSEIARDR